MTDTDLPEYLEMILDVIGVRKASRHAPVAWPKPDKRALVSNPVATVGDF